MGTAEKIYSASTHEDAAGARLSERLARLIEDEIASNNIPAGGAMGSLRELSQRYSVGRAAAREAVALLERRGLGRLRPGPCGGFIVTQPECRAIALELANYFRMAGVTLAQLRDAREAVNQMAAHFAADRPIDCAQSAALPWPEPGAPGLDAPFQAQACVARLTGEPVIELFVDCLNEVTRDFAAAQGPGDWTGEIASLRQAIDAGDTVQAATWAERLEEGVNRLLQREDGALALPTIETSRLHDDRTLSTLVARKLAAEILSKADQADRRLGSEWDLCDRFSVSRATLRQAIRQLQDTGLVDCRRGRGNGLVIRDLRGTGSIRLVLAFLIGQQMDPNLAGTMLFRINRFVPALAVSRADDAGRAELEALLSRVEQSDPIDRYDLLRLVQSVSERADSPVIDLFSRCLAAYEARFLPFLAERLPGQVQAEYFGLLRRLLGQPQAAGPEWLDEAKRESSRIMLEMSRSRPI